MEKQFPEGGKNDCRQGDDCSLGIHTVGIPSFDLLLSLFFPLTSDFGLYQKISKVKVTTS